MTEGSGAPRDLVQEPVLDGYFVAAPQASRAVAGARIPPVLEAAALGKPPAAVSRRTGIGLRIRWSRVALGMGAVAIAIASLAVPGGGAGAEGEWGFGETFGLALSTVARPTPQRADSSTPLGAPQLAPPDRGSYEFAAVQLHSAAPVTYDPCRLLPYVVNGRTAPPGADALVENALARMTEVTGLRFVAEGATDEQPTDARPAFQRERYGDRWAPILVAWSDETEVPELAGDVAGRAGSVRIEVDGRFVYVTGMVTLDGPQLGEALATSRRGQAHVRAVILHELGHLVGLDHVDDPAQLMHPVTGRNTHFQSGDLTGLTRLGAGACVPLL